MQLFIDTNILLSFYHFTNDDLEELRKLIVLLREKQVTLYVTGQLQDEFERNRDSKISDALKRLTDQRLNLEFPQLCRDYQEYDELRRLQKEYERQHASLLQNLKADIENNNLKADSILRELFRLSKQIPLTEESIAKAKSRLERGNPPGKKGSLGDAINWELLLSGVPAQQDLYLITDDGDYCSPLDAERANSFLVKEWRRCKKASLYLSKKLSRFFRDKFPHIRLATELEKDLLIGKLTGSSSFSETHSIIAELSRFQDFTYAQINDIISAVLSNRQVYWIIGDGDVYEFVTKLVSRYESKIEPTKLQELRVLLEGGVQDDKSAELDS